LVAGIGVRGDAHAGATVKHRSRVARDATAPNLRHVHLVHRELFDELAGKGLGVGPGDIGENVVTEGAELLSLPAGTRLHLGAGALVRKAGVMSVVLEGGVVRPGAVVRVALPAPPHRAPERA
jgi:MOSC domain-containing protein YiiM